MVHLRSGGTRRTAPTKGSDLISLLLDIEEDGEVLTEEELYAQCVLLLGAGHDTTRNLIGNGMYTLLRPKLNPTHRTPAFSLPTAACARAFACSTMAS